MVIEIVTSLLIAIGSIFMLIASIGILKLPDFYTRMSAITKASTLGLGMILLGISIHFDQVGVFAKAFIIITLLLLTNPVGAHAISRAAYKQKIKQSGFTIIDELNILHEKVEQLEQQWLADKTNINIAEKLVNEIVKLPASHGGSFSRALEIAEEIAQVQPAIGHRLLGTTYGKMGRFEKAESLLKIACTECNYSPQATFALTDFYVENKLPNRAIAALKDAIKLHPSNYEYLMRVILIAFDSGTSNRFAIECCNRLIEMSEEAPSDYLIQASGYKRYFIERSTGQQQ
ncbi:MAG: Na+/H+ antiporter subunit G [Bacteroidales bacterium]|nr:Na+/H+ antiporter subunit G [Bacteroidales bacterium]